MITYEQEHDFANWDLQLFNSDPYANCGYGGVVTLEDEEHCPANYFEEDCYDAGECCNIENDEAIAHTLQLQELSQLVVFESPNQGEEEELQLHVVGYPQDCIVDQSVILVLDRIGARKSGMAQALQELTDEHALDGEVEKRLNQMVPLPFRALSDQFYRSPDDHEFLRQQVVNQLKSYPDIYEGYVLTAYGVVNGVIMSLCKAAADLSEENRTGCLKHANDLLQYGVKIFFITSFKDTCYNEILPNVQRSKRGFFFFFLSFWAEVHYNSIYPFGDVPGFGTKKKKRRRMFRNKHLESQDEYQ
ncbi:hypothetical protein V6N13_066265 [Hibiscus sabdariffa]